MAARFQIHQVRNVFGLRRFRIGIVAKNGEPLSPNQQYNDIRDAEHACELIRDLDKSTPIEYVAPLVKPVRKGAK